MRCGDGCDGLEIDFATISRDDKGTIAIDVEREGCAQEVERVAESVAEGSVVGSKRFGLVFAGPVMGAGPFEEGVDGELLRLAAARARMVR